MEHVLTGDMVLTELNQKIDKLTTQIEFLTEEALRQKQRQEMWDELKNELMPIANDAYRLSVEQLQEIEPYVQLEDLLQLVKRLLRNTGNLELLLDQTESVMELWQEASPLSREVFSSLTQQLVELEQKGYFLFLQGGLEMMDRIVAAFDAEDVRQLGENIVLILQTVKEMTQPEIMTMLSNTVHIVADEEPVDTSVMSIIRQLNDPAVRKGLAKTLQVLKSVADT